MEVQEESPLPGQDIPGGGREKSKSMGSGRKPVRGVGVWRDGVDGEVRDEVREGKGGQTTKGLGLLQDA